jgi:ABC-type Fe3+/spermidine/putrescine transport system ATPase subunit
MIELKNLCVNVGCFMLSDINLSINDGDYFIILGPTGAGKTVLLESIAGLYPVSKGEIRLGDKDISGVVPESRRISIVYQDHALFPHLSVWGNIAFGLRMRKEKTPRIASEIQRVAELFRIEHLLLRRPDTLSGGERQKVALARAIVTSPEVLLLDEPLGALDPESREKVQEELVKLHSELAVTMLHVTHDFEEAIAMGTKVAVIGGGLLKQVGTPQEIFRRPNSEFVARFVMAKNILTGIAEKKADGSTVFQIGIKEFITTSALEGKCQASIRPEDIFISGEPIHENVLNCFPAKITRIVNKGSIFNVTASLPPDLTCLLTRHSFEEMGLKNGQQVFMTFEPSSVHLFLGQGTG